MTHREIKLGQEIIQLLFNTPAQWPIRILWVTKQKSSQRSLKATVGEWIEIWSTTDNAARPTACRAAE